MAKNKKKESNVKWIIQISILAFIISFCFSFASETILANVNVLVGILVLLLFILIGIIFDMVGVAITSSDIGPFNSMSAQKVKGADVAVIFVKNAAKLSTFCNDVIGDICGIISGSISASLVVLLHDTPLMFIIFTAIISSFTVGGKAVGKKIAIDYNEKIVFLVGKILNKFTFKRKFTKKCIK